MSIREKRIILVEGKDDCYFMSQLLKHKAINAIMVESFNGKDKLTSHINSLIKRDGFDEVISMLIFMDSDKSAGSAGDSINYSLRSTGLIANNIVSFKVSNQFDRKIGFGLFPGYDEKGELHNTGTLEDLCVHLFKENSNRDLIINYLDDFQAKNGDFRQRHKNELHALFSFTDKYVGLKIGTTAEAGGFDFDSPYLEPFIKLINEAVL